MYCPSVRPSGCACGSLLFFRLPPRKSEISENHPCKNHYLSAGMVKNSILLMTFFDKCSKTQYF